MPNSKPAAAYPREDCKMEKNFTKTANILGISCKEGGKFKSTRCEVNGRTCNCPPDMIRAGIKGTVSFPEGAEEVAFEAFGLNRLYTILSLVGPLR